MNEIIVTGNLTTSVEVSLLPNEKKTLKGKFGLAVNRTHSNQQSNDFFNCEIFGEMANTHKNNIDVGSKVLVRGEMHIDRDGDKNIYPKIIISSIEYLDSKATD